MPTIKNLLVTVPATPAHRAALESRAPGAAFTYIERNNLRPGDVKGRDVIIGSIPLPLLPEADALRWLQLSSAGADGFMAPGAMPEGAVLTSATGAYGQAVAEHAFAMWAALVKRLPQYRDGQTRRAWADLGEVTGLFGKTVLVVGFGDIGRTFARLMRPFDSRILAIVRSARPDDLADEVYESLDSLDTLLPRADVVLLSLPDTGETRHAINPARLARMKPTAILLNVGRGTAVDTEALCDAVEAGQILGAGIDVTDPEPLPPDHRLWGIPGILLTPHVAGGFRLSVTRERMIALFAENLTRYQAGEPMISVVDSALGYAAGKAYHG